MVPSLSRVLVVEDDPASRSFLEIALAKLGYAVEGAENAAEAEEQFASAGVDAFSCVVTDYRMPDRTGLELLAWIKERDPSLATILVTAEGEKQLVAQSLREGAIDFLDKPVDLRLLQAAVVRAIERTRRQRHLAQSESAVKELGQAQHRMLGVDALGSAGRVDLCFYPKHEAGGDFFSRFQPTPDRLFCLITDVSGHDLHAAYISAYFQGLVRGLLARGAPVQEIFPEFNRFLLEEWNQAQLPRRDNAGLGTSIAAGALLIDFAAQTATSFIQGIPAPVYIRPDGELQVLGGGGGFPLGWFPELTSTGATFSVADGGAFYLWTDGLEDLAEKQEVSALSLACALRQAQEHKTKPAWLDAAADDILLAVLQLSAPVPATGRFQPLICEQYHGRQTGEIDSLQLFWQRSLVLAVPGLSEGRLHDILLASREALLNALNHGCGGQAGKTAIFQIAYRSLPQTISVRVSDSGPGHQFDSVRHERQAAEDLIERHRGLILIRHLASTVNFERNGAVVIMHFDGP